MKFVLKSAVSAAVFTSLIATGAFANDTQSDMQGQDRTMVQDSSSATHMDKTGKKHSMRHAKRASSDTASSNDQGYDHNMGYDSYAPAAGRTDKSPSNSQSFNREGRNADTTWNNHVNQSATDTTFGQQTHSAVAQH